MNMPSGDAEIDAQISDEEVVHNFVDDIAEPDGALRQYLAHGSVAAVFGNTLFVHGAVDRQTMGFIPTHTRFELPAHRSAVPHPRR